MALYIRRNETDPFFNIAAEEFALKSLPGDAFMLWRNTPSVILGKHQNAAREINQPFLYSEDIPVTRRISGGGTVYHDLGNINYSFIFHDRKNNPVNYREFTRPIMGFLEDLGLKARFVEKNHIFLKDKKISGNSAHVFKDRVLFHGTLLFDTNLDQMEKALHPKEGNYQDRAVSSTRSEVTNIITHLHHKIPVEQFMDLLYKYIGRNDMGATDYSFTGEEAIRIEELADRKYRTWEWIYGYSPRYILAKEIDISGNKMKISLTVEKGLIREAQIEGHGEEVRASDKMLSLLEGQPHIYGRLKAFIRENKNFKKDEINFLNQITEAVF